MTGALPRPAGEGRPEGERFATLAEALAARGFTLGAPMSASSVEPAGEPAAAGMSPSEALPAPSTSEAPPADEPPAGSGIQPLEPPDEDRWWIEPPAPDTPDEAGVEESLSLVVPGQPTGSVIQSTEAAALPPTADAIAMTPAVIVPASPSPEPPADLLDLLEAARQAEA